MTNKAEILTTNKDDILATIERYFRSQNPQWSVTLCDMLVEIPLEEAFVWYIFLTYHVKIPLQNVEWQRLATHLKPYVLDGMELRSYTTGQFLELLNEIPGATVRVIERDFGKDAATLFKLSDGLIDPREM